MGQGKSKNHTHRQEKQLECNTEGLERGEKAKVSGTGIGPGWVALSKAEQHQLFADWTNLSGGRTSISTSELLRILLLAKLDADLAKLLVRSYDLDGDGVIDLAEFQAFLAISVKGTIEDKLRASFHAFDTNNDGTLSREELKPKIRSVIRRKQQLFSPSTAFSAYLDVDTDEVVDYIFSLIDLDCSNSIDIDEFVVGFAKNQQVIQLLSEMSGGAESFA